VSPAGGEGLLDFSGEAFAYAVAVQRENKVVIFRESLGKPLRDRYLLGNAQLVQLHSGAGELGAGLDKIAGVCPEAGMVEGHDHVSAFTGEAGKPPDLFPAFGRIFARVRVAAGEEHRIPAAAAHHRAQRFYPSRKTIVHICTNIAKRSRLKSAF